MGIFNNTKYDSLSKHNEFHMFAMRKYKNKIFADIFDRASNRIKTVKIKKDGTVKIKNQRLFVDFTMGDFDDDDY